MGGKGFADQISDSIAAGRGDATLIPWNGNPNLLGIVEPDPERAIAEAVLELIAHGWVWVSARNQLERDGWKVWFRSQGNCGAPIAQWSRI